MRLFFIYLVATAVVLIGVVLPLAIYRQSEFIREHHCATAGESRQEVMYVLTDVGNNTNIMMPQFYYVYEYKCDDGMHWF